MKNYLLAGVGGQGTVLASKILAQSAVDNGEDIRTAETIGMAQRGGCVVSHVRIGKDIFSPLIPKGKADVLIGFEPSEAVRNIDYLKDGGTVVVNKKAIKPTTDALSEKSYNGDEMLDYLKTTVKNVVIIDGDSICEKCGSSKVLNIVLLAAAAKVGVLDINFEQFKEVINTKIPEKFRELNLKAAELAANLI